VKEKEKARRKENEKEEEGEYDTMYYGCLNETKTGEIKQSTGRKTTQ